MKGLFLLLILCLALGIVIGDICIDKVYSTDPTFGIQHHFIVNVPDTSNYLLFQETGDVHVIEDSGGYYFTDTGIDVQMGLQYHLDKEGGFRHAIFHPDFLNNGRMFVFYACDYTTDCGIPNGDPDCDIGCCEEPCMTADGYIGIVSEFVLDTTTWTVGAEKWLIRLAFPDLYHLGGGMVFDDDGMLILGMGDGSASDDLRQYTQDMANPRGKMLRINIDEGDLYTVPTDNPFYNTPGADPRIWSVGIRQPYRCTIDRVGDGGAGDLICSNVGQTSVESVYRIRKGSNAGWGRWEGNMFFQNFDLAPGWNDSTVELSVFDWCRGTLCDGLDICYDPPCNPRTSAAIGGFVYRGQEVPEMVGKYIVGDWDAGEPDIWLLDPSPNDRWDFQKHRMLRPNPVPQSGLDYLDPPTGYLYGFYPDRNNEMLILLDQGIFRLVALENCGLSASDFNTTNETLNQPDIDIPYEYRAFKTPPTISSAAGLLDTELEVAQYSFSDPGVLSFDTRAYNGNIPGPTIRIRAGDDVKINLKNSLPPNYAYPPDETVWNTYHKAETTNLHTHGLHVSSQGNADNIWIAVEPSTEFQYEYDIHNEHASGVNYYHAHFHGSTMLQVQGGLFGTLIVDPEPTPALQPLLSLPEDLITLWVVSLDTDNSENYDEVAENTESQFISNMNGQIPGLNYYTFVNGVFQPTLQMTKDELRLFRFVNTASYAFLIAFNNSDACTMYVAAKDGIYVDAPYQVDEVFLGPANRADLLVKCTDPGLFSIISKSTNDVYHVAAQTLKMTIMYLEVTGQASTILNAQDIVLPARPAYLPDLVSPSDPVYKSEDLAFSYGHQINRLNLEGTYDYSDLWLAGTIQQTKLSATAFHPVHMHVNHFQIVHYEFADTSGNQEILFKVGEWRDTVPVMEGLKVTVRWYLDSYVGHVITHCHISSHADQGMIRLAYIAEEEELNEQDKMRFKTTVIDDYQYAYKNALFGSWGTDLTLAETYDGVNQTLKLEVIQADSGYVYNEFSSGFSERSSGIWFRARIVGNVQILCQVRITVNEGFYEFPYVIEDTTEATATVKEYFLTFDSIVNPSEFDSGSINTFSMAFLVAPVGSYIEIEHIGYFRDLEVERDDSNAPIGPPTASPTPKPRLDRVYGPNLFETLADFTVTGGSGGDNIATAEIIDGAPCLTLEIIDNNVETSYAYFTFPIAESVGQDGIYMYVSVPDGMVFHIDLREVGGELLFSSDSRSGTVDGFEEFFFEYTPGLTFDSMAIVITTGMTGQEFQLKEMGFFSDLITVAPTGPTTSAPTAGPTVIPSMAPSSTPTEDGVTPAPTTAPAVDEPTDPNPETRSAGDGDMGPMIAGASLGTLVVVAVVSAAAFFMLKRRKESQQVVVMESKESNESMEV